MFRYGVGVAIVATVVCFSAVREPARAQTKVAEAKELRCEFPLNATGKWAATGVPEAAVAPAKLLLRFDTINADEGTATLRNGSVGSEIIMQSAAENLHFIQSFRSGPLYVTTVFGQETTGGRLKAVHSRHENFKTPLEGTTSSPEQYYGECAVVK